MSDDSYKSSDEEYSSSESSTDESLFEDQEVGALFNLDDSDSGNESDYEREHTVKKRKYTCDCGGNTCKFLKNQNV